MGAESGGGGGGGGRIFPSQEISEGRPSQKLGYSSNFH